jgi:hypothetical protein
LAGWVQDQNMNGVTVQSLTLPGTSAVEIWSRGKMFAIINKSGHLCGGRGEAWLWDGKKWTVVEPSIAAGRLLDG